MKADVQLADGVGVLYDKARQVLRLADQCDVQIACAESCTGGLLCSLLTDVEGCAGAFERGFITYSEASKAELLGVDRGLIARAGVVSKEVAEAMARGALERSAAGAAVAITGFAGPGGPRDEEGLVHLCACTRHGAVAHRECHFGPRGRDDNRHLATGAALDMLIGALEDIIQTRT